MECAAANHFMRNRGWVKIIDACLQHPSVRQHQVGGKSWEPVVVTTRTENNVACGQGACRDALQSLLGVLGQIRGYTTVVFV